MRNRDLCGACGKEILATRADRDGAEAAYKKRYPKAKAYRCPVGDWWHITKGQGRRGRR
jgi:hypothetical protein